MNRSELEQLDRDTLIVRAEEAGVSRARILTRPELVDELLLRSAADLATKQRARGLFGRARDLLARVVERGLHLPDAADRIRSLGGVPIVNRPSAPAALPTLTLAEIYAAQGHRARAIETLERVLAREPDHTPARALLGQLADANYLSIPPRLPPEPEDAMARAQDAIFGDDTALEPIESSLPPEGVAGGPIENDGREPSAARAEVVSQDSSQPVSGGVVSQGSSTAATTPITVTQAPAAEPLGMLDDAPLPPRYDVDECVAMPVDPTTLYVYWEIRDVTLEYLRRAHPSAVIALRFVLVLPTWQGPRPIVRDHDVLLSIGDFFARDLPGGCIVRVAIGLRDETAFEPIAHCPGLEMPRGAPWPLVADTVLQWSPDRRATGSRDGGDARAIEVAAMRARRDSAGAERARRVLDAPLGASEGWVVAGSRPS